MKQFKKILLSLWSSIIMIWNMIWMVLNPILFYASLIFIWRAVVLLIFKENYQPDIKEIIAMLAAMYFYFSHKLREFLDTPHF